MRELARLGFEASLTPPPQGLAESMASNTTFAKRQKERARQDRQREKDAKRKQRREEKDATPRAPTEEGVDPDIAGIVPGPQPIVEDDF